jgi:hypothetical protein
LLEIIREKSDQLGKDRLVNGLSKAAQTPKISALIIKLSREFDCQGGRQRVACYVQEPLRFKRDLK